LNAFSFFKSTIQNKHSSIGNPRCADHTLIPEHVTPPIGFQKPTGAKKNLSKRILAKRSDELHFKSLKIAPQRILHFSVSALPNLPFPPPSGPALTAVSGASLKNKFRTVI
jgi:hypothetical protein